MESKVNELLTQTQSIAASMEQVRHSVAGDMQTEYFNRIASNQLSYMETVQMVSRNRLSLARLGDGELMMAADPYRGIRFQKGSHELSRELRDVVSRHRPGLLVGLPGYVVDDYWITTFAKYWGALQGFIPQDRCWGIYSVSRASAFRDGGRAMVQAWKSCWDGRNVTIVTGKDSRFDLKEDLFDTANVEFIYGPSSNAYAQVDDLEKEILGKERDIVLISLGPTATVLVARLWDHGVQALDIGHLSASFDQAFSGAPAPEQLPVSK